MVDHNGEKMKVLNLYAGIGGNRKLWEDVEVTAVEIDPKIAAIYSDFFPDDKMVVGDAHQYLLDHYKEFDFIWSSPPCPTHSHLNHILNKQGHIRYPDMALYQEIIFLQTFLYESQYCIENVRSYYDPLIKPQYIDRHYFWANFYITDFSRPRLGFDILNVGFNTKNAKHERAFEDENTTSLQELHGFNLEKFKLATYKKRKILRNAVYPPLGKHILDCVRGNTQVPLTSFSISKRMEAGESG